MATPFFHVVDFHSASTPPGPQVYDDIWGSSQRAPSYASLRRQAAPSDWLVRSLEPLPGGGVVIRRENLKQAGGTATGAEAKRFEAKDGQFALLFCFVCFAPYQSRSAMRD